MEPLARHALVIGHLTVDDIVLPTGETAMETAGGDSLYASLGVRIWGVIPRLIASRPQGYPVRILNAIQEKGVDTDYLQTVSVPGVRQWALYDQKGGRQYHLQTGSSTYDDISPCVDKAGALPDPIFAAHVAPMPSHVQYDWVRWLAKRQCRWILVDPHEDALRDWEIWKRILSYTTVFLPSEVEVAGLLGPNINGLDAARRLSQWGPRIVVIKRGPHGSLFYDRETNQAREFSALAVEAVDPTGCGDAYCGGFAAALCIIGDPGVGAEWGTVSASFVLESYGPHRVMHVNVEEAMHRWQLYRTQQERREGSL